MKTILLFILLATWSTAIGQNKSVGELCRPIECVYNWKNSSGTKQSIKKLRIYDEQGRLLLDSVNIADTALAFPNTSIRFSYAADSITCIDHRQDTVLVLLNDKGLPRLNYVHPGCLYYHAFYNPDGTLQKIIRSCPANWDGKYVEDQVIDSMVYVNGNIISFRVKFYEGISFVHCTYFADKPFAQVFDPTEKLFAFCGSPLGLTGTFNVQPFSKCLLKSITYDRSLWYYNYQTDKQGKVIGMERITGFATEYESKTQINYSYSCK